MHKIHARKPVRTRARPYNRCEGKVRLGTGKESATVVG